MLKGFLNEGKTSRGKRKNSQIVTNVIERRNLHATEQDIDRLNTRITGSRDMPQYPWNEYESIYSYLMERQNEKDYSSDCPLPEDCNLGEDKWGPLDMFKKNDANTSEIIYDAVDRITKLIVLYCNTCDDILVEELYKEIININIVLVIDDLIDNLVQCFEDLSIENLYLLSIWLCRDACHRGVILFAISILGRIRMEEDLIEVLGKHEDFVIPMAMSITTEGINVENRLMKLAEGVDGMAKLEVLNLIEPTNNTVKDWFLQKAWQTDGKAPTKLAKVCAIKGGLIEVVRTRYINTRIIFLTGHLLNIFLKDSDYEEFLSYRDGAEVINRYVSILSMEDLDEITFMALRHVKKFLKESCGVECLGNIGLSYGEIQDLINHIENTLMV